MRTERGIRYRWALAALLLCPAAALPQAAPPADWAALQLATPTPPGPGFADRLREGGFTLEQARPVIATLGAAAKGGLPVDTLVLRAGEGLTKKAPPDAIAQAVQARARALERSDAALTGAGYKDCEAVPRRELLVAVALAIESGVPEDDLCDVLQAGAGQSSGRMQSVIEAGETMRLAGLDRGTTLTLMRDCMERSLRRMEILRAVRFTIEQHHKGVGGPEILNSLWGSSAPNRMQQRGPPAGNGGFGHGGHGGGPPAHAGGHGAPPGRPADAPAGTASNSASVHMLPAQQP